MAGFVIHLAIAQEHLKKSKRKEENEEQFIFGSVQPDFIMPKTASHYGATPEYTDLKKFLKNNDIESSIDRGRFLHLITDYLFYNHYLGHYPREELNDDYDFANKQLVEKYNVNVIKEVKDKIYFKEGTPKHMTFDLACKVIDEISELDLDQVKKEVLKDNKNKWNTYKED